MLKTSTKQQLLKKSILNDVGLHPDLSIESITNNIIINEKDTKLDKVSLRILALTFNMAGGLPNS
jgi:hypothetical protein